MRVERGFALALLFATMTVGAASSRSAGPVGVERLLAADTPQGTTLFLTDGASPAIFSVEKLSGLTPQKIPLSSLTPFLFESGAAEAIGDGAARPGADLSATQACPRCSRIDRTLACSGGCPIRWRTVPK